MNWACERGPFQCKTRAAQRGGHAKTLEAALFLEAPGEFAVVELDVGRAPRGAGNRRGRCKKLAQQGERLDLAGYRGKAHGLRRRKARQLVPGQVDIRRGHPPLAKRTHQVPDESLRVPGLHPRRKRLDPEKIAAELRSEERRVGK